MKLTSLNGGILYSYSKALGPAIDETIERLFKTNSDEAFAKYIYTTSRRQQSLFRTEDSKAALINVLMALEIHPNFDNVVNELNKLVANDGPNTSRED